jgi:hypothetical protein
VMHLLSNCFFVGCSPDMTCPPLFHFLCFSRWTPTPQALALNLRVTAISLASFSVFGLVWVAVTVTKVGKTVLSLGVSIAVLGKMFEMLVLARKGFRHCHNCPCSPWLLGLTPCKNH